MLIFLPFLASLWQPRPSTYNVPTNDSVLSSDRSPLPSLPPEIWLLIIRQAALSVPFYRTCTTPSRLAWLASISQLSAEFRTLAQLELFSTGVVQSQQQLKQLIETLEKSFVLRRALRGLHVRWRERECAERAGEGAKDLNKRSADGWENGVGRVAHLVELRELSLSYAGEGRARFDLGWVAGSRETLAKIILDSINLHGTPDIISPFFNLTSLTLRDCTLSPNFGAVLPCLFPSLRSLTLQPASNTSLHIIHTILVPLAPQLESLTWAPIACADHKRAGPKDSVLLVLLPLCTSIISLGIPISSLRNLRPGQLPLSLRRLRLYLNRTGNEANEVLRVMEMLPSAIETVEMNFSGWISVQAGEDVVQQIQKRVAGKVELGLVQDR